MELIELRTNDKSISISDLRKSFTNMELGDVSVKNFGNDNDFIVKFEKKEKLEENFIVNLKNELKKDLVIHLIFGELKVLGQKLVQ